MKIVNSISKIYNEGRPYYEKLKTEVDNQILLNKRETWHYYSRIKQIESFALKLETGRVEVPNKMDDFFACTLVVENIKEIQNAILFLENIFDILQRKPPTDDMTYNLSSSFAFEDLRLYVKMKSIDYLVVSDLHNLMFEIQIKTFLQHAWSIATHDLIYKSDNISWSKERIAYQIKAMLEQAEISISGVDSLSLLPELAKNSNISKALSEIKLFVIDVFPLENLPSDILRLCNIISDILKYFEIDLIFLKKVIEKETSLKRGISTLNLSPYSIILQSLVNQDPLKFEKVFKRNYRGSRKKILLPSEISLDAIVIENNSRIIRI